MPSFLTLVSTRQDRQDGFLTGAENILFSYNFKLFDLDCLTT